MNFIKKTVVIVGVSILVSAVMLIGAFVVGVWSVLTGEQQPSGRQPFRV